jgi:transposase InsO family protein
MNRGVRLMRQAKLQARHKRRRLPGDMGSRLENHIAPNHLQRGFNALAPNKKWLTSLTSARLKEGCKARMVSKYTARSEFISTATTSRTHAEGCCAMSWHSPIA